MRKEKRYRYECLSWDEPTKRYVKKVVECTMAEAEARHDAAMKGDDEAEKARTCALLNNLRTQAKLPVPVC